MSEILLYYERVNPTTWVYLSSLLIIALFFKFNRLWSVRNLDLIGLILLAPGLLFVIYGQEKEALGYEQAGYIWLFSIDGLFLVRMLLDPMMVRRPLLEPNLSVGGMTFLGLSLLIFLMANVVTDRQSVKHFKVEAANAVAPTDTAEPKPADQPVADQPERSPPEQPLVLYGPGYPWVFEIFQLPTRFLFETDNKAQSAASDQERDSQRLIRLATVRTVAIFSHLAIVLGLVVVGYRHFDNIRTGIAAAVLYLLLPYTAILTGQYMAVHVGQVYHVLLAALLVWAIVMYRRPLISGILLGSAIGMFYYPIFLLPLWCSFYWQRGALAVWRRRNRHVGVIGGPFVFPSVQRFIFERPATDVRLDLSPDGAPARVLGTAVQLLGVPHSGAGDVCGHVHHAGGLACAEKPRHVDELFDGGNAGHTVLARFGRRTTDGLVFAAVAVDHFPTEFGRPHRAIGIGRVVVHPPQEQSRGLRQSIKPPDVHRRQRPCLLLSFSAPVLIDRSSATSRSVPICQAGYTVYPVNPKGGEVEGLTAYTSLAEVPAGKLDRISVYLPPHVGLKALDEIAARGCDELWLNPGTRQPGSRRESQQAWIERDPRVQHHRRGNQSVVVARLAANRFAQSRRTSIVEDDFCEAYQVFHAF